MYAFLNAELHTGFCELRVDGRVVPLEPRIYDLLLYLIEQRHRVITKAELMDRLWPSVTVNDGVLKRAVWVLRTTLHAAGIADPLATLPRRGYRFAASVTGAGGGGSAVGASDPAERAADDPFEGLVGRRREVTELCRAIDRVLAGRGSVLLLQGEPGVGKSSLVDAACELARRRGARVLVARGHEGDGAPAFWIWIQILRAYLEGCDDTEQLRQELGLGARYVSRVFPELRTHLPELDPGEEQKEEGRFPVLDALAQFFHNTSRAQPTVVLLDDLQWADRGSIELLELLTRQIAASPLLVLGTLRDQVFPAEHWLTRLLGAVAHAPDCIWLTVSGLDRAGVADLLEMHLGAAPDLELAETVHAKTDGNPFFVREIARLFGREGHEARAAGAFHVPERLRDAVLRRATALPPGASRVLIAASVLGHVFERGVLQTILKLPGTEMLAALDAAVSARLLDDLRDGRFRFAHALVQEILYATLTSAERALLHQKAAQALEPWAREGDGVDEVARHYYEVVDVGAWREALEWAREAGYAAMRRLGFEKAELQFQRALEIVKVHAPGDQRMTTELVIALGDTQRALGAPAHVIKTSYLRAARLARHSGWDEALVMAALGYTGHGEAVDPYARYSVVSDPERLELLERASAVVPKGGPLEVRLLCRLAQELDGGHGARRVALLDQASGIAVSARDPRLQAATLLARCVVLGDEPERWAESKSAACDALWLARSVGDPSLEVSARQHLAVTAVQAADPAEIAIHSEAMATLAGQLRGPLETACVLAYDGMLAALQGRFAAALAFNERFTAAVGDRFVGGREFAEAQLLKLQSLQGSIDQVSRGDAVPLFRGRRMASTAWRAGFAWWLLRQGALDEARTEFEALVGLDGPRLEINGARPSSLTYLADVAVAFADVPRARVLYRELLPFADRLMAVASVYCDGAAARPLGRLAALMGEHAAAERHFVRALELHRRLSATPFVVLTLFQFARELQRLGARGRALELEAEAYDAAAQIGMRLYDTHL